MMDSNQMREIIIDMVIHSVDYNQIIVLNILPMQCSYLSEKQVQIIREYIHHIHLCQTIVTYIILT